MGRIYRMPETYLRKYFIMGSQDCVRDTVTILHEAILGGITAFKYREKVVGALIGHEKLALAKQLRQLCAQHSIPFISHDDVELVEELDVDGIHVGQDDINVAALHQLHPNIQIGLSISNEEELQKSPLQLIDYVGAGPVYPTNSKPDAKEAVGLHWVSKFRAMHPTLPIVGIGGIQSTNAAEVIHAGANGVAVISAITKATDVKRAVSLL